MRNKNPETVIHAVKKPVEATRLTVIFAIFLASLLGLGFTGMLASTFMLPINYVVFTPVLIAISALCAYCHFEKGKATSIIVLIFFAFASLMIVMFDIFYVRASAEYAYSVLQQRAFQELRPMLRGAAELKEAKTDVTCLMILINILPAYFTTLMVEKRLSVLLSLVWYIPFFFATTRITYLTPAAWPCQLAVAGILLLLLFGFVKRLGDGSTDKRMLILAAPVIAFCMLVAGMFPSNEYSYNKLATKYYDGLQNFLHELHVKLQNKHEEPEDEVKHEYEGYMGSVVAGNGEGQGLATTSFSEDFSKVGFFNPPDVKIFEVSRNVNDNHIILLQGRIVYLRCASLEVLDNGSWSTYDTNKDPKVTLPDSHFITEDRTEPKEADFVITINTLCPIDAKLIPEYVDHFYIGSDSKYSEMDLTESATWNLQEIMYSNGASSYSYAYNMVPRKRDVDWTDSYLKEVYETCLYVPEETKKSLLECGKLPEWYLELLEDPSKMSAAEKVARVVEYVRNLHPYSKDTPYPPEGADFVTWFISESRSGFCVHYATTAAVLLRMIDVPTRYVSGYYADTDPGGKPSLVSMQNAHAWFEFFDPDYGWVLDDPTPGNNVVASYFNAYAIAKEYGDMVYDFQFTPTPSPQPVRTVTPVPEEIEEEGGSSYSGVIRVLVAILSVLLVIGALRLGYVLFWKLRLRNKTTNEKASVYNSYYKMHLYILEGKGSRAVKKIVDKAEFSRDTISEKELSYIIRFGEHNLEKQKKGASRLRKAISYILRVHFQDKGVAAESAESAAEE